MNRSRALMGTVGVVAMCAVAPSATAGATVKIDDVKSVTVGAGLRTSYNSFEDAAPSGNENSSDFQLDSIRLYMGATLTDKIKLEFNTERQSDSSLRVLDAIAKFEYSEMFNVWAGRFLPPSDRANLSGPYYQNAWNFPAAQAYPAIFAGRDDGVAVWGSTGGGQFKYQVGAFEGVQGEGTGNQDDKLLFAARVVANFLDPEPGYYNSSTYYGDKSILAVGLTYQTQGDAAGAPDDGETGGRQSGDFTGYSVDALYEMPIADAGTVSVEGAYYDYDWDDLAPAQGYQGKGYFVLASYLFQSFDDNGRIQPMVRVQKVDVDNGGEVDIKEFGLNYIMRGHDIRLSFVYGNADVESVGDNNFFQFGLQLQI